MIKERFDMCEKNKKPDNVTDLEGHVTSSSVPHLKEWNEVKIHFSRVRKL